MDQQKDEKSQPIQSGETKLVRENRILVATGQLDDDVAQNWLTIINDNRERNLLNDDDVLQKTNSPIQFVNKGGVKVIQGIPSHEINEALEKDREERMTRLMNGLE